MLHELENFRVAGENNMRAADIKGESVSLFRDTETSGLCFFFEYENFVSLLCKETCEGDTSQPSAEDCPFYRHDFYLIIEWTSAPIAERFISIASY